jgi:hypothetical protein
MNNFVSNAPYNSLFIIYLLISCNFLAQLFGCQLQKLLRDKMYVKHMFGFVTMLFCIIFVDSSIQKEYKYAEGFAYAIIFYLWFWATTKTHLYITSIIILFFLVIYVLQLQKNSLDQDENKDTISQISTAQNILALIAFIITIIGFILYYIEKSNEFKENFDSYKFIFGTTDCNNDKLSNITTGFKQTDNNQTDNNQKITFKN